VLRVAEKLGGSGPGTGDRGQGKSTEPDHLKAGARRALKDLSFSSLRSALRLSPVPGPQSPVPAAERHP